MSSVSTLSTRLTTVFNREVISLRADFTLAPSSWLELAGVFSSTADLGVKFSLPFDWEDLGVSVVAFRTSYTRHRSIYYVTTYGTRTRARPPRCATCMAIGERESFIFLFVALSTVVQIPYRSKCFYLNLFKRHGHKMRPYNAHTYAPSKYFTTRVHLCSCLSSSYGLLC